MKVYYSTLAALIIVSSGCFLFEIHPATRKTELGYENIMQGICLATGILAFLFQSCYLRLKRKKETKVLLHLFTLGIIFYLSIHILDAAFYHASWHPEKSNAGFWMFQIMLTTSGLFYIISFIPKAILALLHKNKRMANQSGYEQ